MTIPYHHMPVQQLFEQNLLFHAEPDGADLIYMMFYDFQGNYIDLSVAPNAMVKPQPEIVHISLVTHHDETQLATSCAMAAQVDTIIHTLTSKLISERHETTRSASFGYRYWAELDVEDLYKRVISSYLPDSPHHQGAQHTESHVIYDYWLHQKILILDVFAADSKCGFTLTLY